MVSINVTLTATLQTKV